MLVSVSPDTLYEREETRRAVRYEIQGLPVTEAYVVRHLYGIGCDAESHHDLASRLDCHVDAIAKLEHEAMTKLFASLRHCA